MKKARPHVRLLIISLPFSLGISSGTAADEEKRPFTVHDSVEMSYFGTVTDSKPAHSYDDGGESPDGRFLVKMTHRGLLPEGVTEGTIWLFNTNEVMKSVSDRGSPTPKPSALVRMSAEINGYTADFYERGNILFQLMWSDDSRYLYFLGRDGQENRQLFRVDVHTKDLKPLSIRDQDAMTYRLVGDSVAYLVGPDVNSESEWISAGAIFWTKWLEPARRYCHCCTQTSEGTRSQVLWSLAFGRYKKAVLSQLLP